MQPDTKPCASCSNVTAADARFCSFCGAPVANVQRPPNPDGGGENRQLTVIFCDLVGSTALSNRFDAEDLRDVIRQYQEICADAIEARDGRIGQYLGDGVMAYFGYPKASESAAIHATDAALDIVAGVAKARETLMRRSGIEFAIRIALHTGRVLIGEMGAGQTRDRHALTGAAPNLAARLEQVAPRNGIAISAQTAALVSDAFEIETLGAHDLKGFPGPVEAFRVLRRRWTMPVIPVRQAPLIGRERELERLAVAWQAVGRNSSRRLSIVAEPGMGKSSVAAAFLSSNGIAPDCVLEIAGTLRDRNTPFACLRQAIERWTGLGAIHAAGSPAEQVARWFGVEEPSRSSHAQTFLQLLDGAIEEGREGRARVLAACRARIASFGRPMLIIAEDAHWIDPSTAEMVERIAAEADRGMLLRLSRPGEEGEGTPAPDDDDDLILLGRLAPGACRRLIESVAGAPVEAGLVKLITDVSGGLPLFVEEFTKSLIESAVVSRVRGVFRPTNLHTTVATPASILDLITVRLDALGEAKALAQVCAVLGRSFDRAALAAVSGEPEARLEAMIPRLIEAGILLREWSGRLTFRHALFQTAAYESLVKGERQACHCRFLDWMQDRPNRVAATPPETTGFHLEACGRHAEAVECYMQAGMLAERASASLEAATHFRKCCDLIEKVPDRAALGALPLRAQVKLAGALLSARGAGATETRDAYDAAIRLAEGLPESEWHFAAYWGWWRVSDSFATMAKRGNWLVEKSRSMQGLEFKLQAQHCVWANAFQTGEFDTSIRSARDGLELYEVGGFDETPTFYGGHDCKVCALGEIALASWLKGAGDAATQPIDAAVAHAEDLEHLGSLLHALDIAVTLHHYRRDAGTALAVAERLIALAKANDLDEYRAKGEIFLGWVQIETGQTREGLARVDAGFAIMQQIGTPEDFPVYQCIRAAALGQLGDPDAAAAALRSGQAVIDAEGVNYWGAEIARLEALIEMMRPGGDPATVAAHLDDARALAEKQGALALELRACLTGLDWARGQGGAVGEAVEALRAVRNRFAPEATGRELAAADAALAPGTPA